MTDYESVSGYLFEEAINHGVVFGQTASVPSILCKDIYQTSQLQFRRVKNSRLSVIYPVLRTCTGARPKQWLQEVN